MTTVAMFFLSKSVLGIWFGGEGGGGDEELPIPYKTNEHNDR